MISKAITGFQHVRISHSIRFERDKYFGFSFSSGGKLEFMLVLMVDRRCFWCFGVNEFVVRKFNKL